MALHALEEACLLGFKAMQFNIVVSTNTQAIALWKKLGFSIVGTLPKVFRHSSLGFVDAYVMLKKAAALKRKNLLKEKTCTTER